MAFITLKRGGRVWRVNTDTWGSALKIQWSAKLPHFVKGVVKESPNFKVEELDVDVIAQYSTTKFSDTSNFKKFIIDAFNSTDMDAAYASLEEATVKVGESAITELKDAFKANFDNGKSKWSPISSQRLARRAAMSVLGMPNQLPDDPTVHYSEDVFKKAIESFTLRIDIDRTKGLFKLGFSSMNVRDIPNAVHPDFVGYKSRYKGPNQILMSIMGLNKSNQKGTSTSGGPMIVPLYRTGTEYGNVWSRTGYRRQVTTKSGGTQWKNIDLGYTQKAMAYLNSSYPQVRYPSKTTPEPEGVPVLFVNSITTRKFHFQQPYSTDERVVFWAKSKGRGGKIVFPENVANILITKGLLSKSVHEV